MFVYIVCGIDHVSLCEAVCIVTTGNGLFFTHSSAQAPAAEPVTSPVSPNGATSTKGNIGNGGVSSPVDRLDNLIASSDRNGTLRSNKEVSVLG